MFFKKIANGHKTVAGGPTLRVCAVLLLLAACMAEASAQPAARRRQQQQKNESNAQTLTTRFQKEFVALIDKDSEAYDEVFACFKLPKATDEEKAVRSAAIQEATRHAALIPMEVARKALEVMPVIADIARLGNRNAITDACVAMMAARSAVLGALLNVRINLGVLKDKEFVQGLQAEADRIEQTACRKEKELLDAVNQDLRV